MAPKKARGGRGRGGSSSGLSAPPRMAEQDQPLQNRQQSGPSSIPHRDKLNTTPELQTDSIDLDPNDSPATQPTETPASTPVRPPPAVQMQPAAGGSGGAAPRGGSRGRGSLSKFKPKNIRRSASELKAFADEDQARIAAAAAIAGRARGRGYGRARAGRGRGDAMGRGRGAAGGGVASGPFAAVPDIDKRGGFAPGSVKREGGGSTSRSGEASHPTIKREGQGHKAGPGGKLPSSDPRYPDEDHSLRRIDIQNINLISSDEDEDDILPAPGLAKGKLPMKFAKGGLKPVRLDRQEHKERTSQVNTAPTVKDMPDEDSKDSDTPMVDEERSTHIDRDARRREFKGTYDDDSMEVKAEPGEPENIIDQLAPGPALARQATEIDGAEGRDEAEPATKQKQKSRPRKHPSKFVIQTEEDRREWERHLEDLEVLKEELGGMQQDTTVRVKSKEDETDAEKPTDNKEGRLYLFQFPPAMPKLINPATLPKRDPVATAGVNNDVQVTGSRDNNVMDLDKPIKPEEEEIIKKEDEEPQTKTKESLATEEGYVGKLIVRESGRVELDWGGSRMLVGRGIETSFLSMGVLVDSKGCFDEDGKPTREGVATGMGKIMGKFLVTPDWESMVDDIERAERRERRR